VIFKPQANTACNSCGDCCEIIAVILDMFEIIVAILLEKVKSITMCALVMLNLACALTKNVHDHFSQRITPNVAAVLIYICCNSVAAVIVQKPQTVNFIVMVS